MIVTMVTHKLEKEVVLYKNQFEEFVLDIFKEHKMERLSIDIDALLFRIKYMAKNHKDVHLIPGLKDEFTSKALELRCIFGEIMYKFLIQVLGLGDSFSEDDIIDVMAQDVKIDGVNVKFKMMLISGNVEYLQFVDSKIEDGEAFNMFPTKFFRHYTDSYNDGIAKAYPELFCNKQQTEIGTGNDADVFCHSFTFQTSENCSLNCIYCLIKGTKILMADFTFKNIEDIKVGDIVLSFPEHSKGRPTVLIPTKVTELFKNTVNKLYRISSPMFSDDLYISGNHPVLTKYGWKNAEDLSNEDEVYAANFSNEAIDAISRKKDFFRSNEHMFVETPITVECIKKRRVVYNFETEEHTYIANKALVHNCYQFNKSKMKMDFSVAKKFIDDLLADKYGYINRYNSPAIILEFIGGEPLLEINLTRKIYEYFLQQTYEIDHPWFKLHRLSICSNGLQYFDEEVQNFFKDYAGNISFNISIDGNKELHDACRIQPNGEGSYDVDIIALNHYNKHYTPERNSKMTLAPENMKYLFDSVVNFIDNGMMTINLNCVFEEGWNQKTALLEYNELKKVADYILEKDLENLYIAIFNEKQEDMSLKSTDGNFCGGLGSMLSLRPNGQFYPCLRYMPTSVGNDVPDLCIGHVDTGIVGREQNSKVLNMMDDITRRSQSNDICYDCPISNDCPWCSALGHSVYGTPGKKPSFICIQMIAEALANVYYWNLLNIKKPEYKLGVRKNNVPDKWALLVIDKEELDFLKMIESRSMITTMEYSN